MPLLYQALALLSFSTVVVHSIPLERSRYLTLKPRAPLSHQATNMTFDPKYATRELQNVMVKYSQATSVLKGVGLNPETHPEIGYPPFTEAARQTSPPPAPTACGTPNQLPIGTGVRATTGGTGPATPIDIVQHRQPAHWPLIDDISGTLDTLYYGSMEFGTPSQALPVDIDTGSADLWVEANCPGCSNDQLKNSVSSTYAASTRKCSLAYATGRVSGTLAQDRVAAGTLSVSNQTFCAARKVSSDMDDEPISGLVGLAFGSIAKSGQPTFFENLLTQHKLPFSIFSVHLTRQQETGSEVCFGCFDPTKALGPISWHPLVSRTYWSIAMDGLSVKLPDGPQEVLANMIAAIDTGTSLIYLPKDIAERFYALIPGAEAATDRFGPGFYTFPCNTTLTVQLMFGSRPFIVDPFDFNLGAVAEDPETCVGGILALGDGLAPGLAIIGDEFLKSWYSVFDYSGRVGFAQSINNQY